MPNFTNELLKKISNQTSMVYYDYEIVEQEGSTTLYLRNKKNTGQHSPTTETKIPQGKKIRVLPSDVLDYSI